MDVVWNPCKKMMQCCNENYNVHIQVFKMYNLNLQDNRIIQTAKGTNLVAVYSLRSVV